MKLLTDALLESLNAKDKYIVEAFLYRKYQNE